MTSISAQAAAAREAARSEGGQFGEQSRTGPGQPLADPPHAFAEAAADLLDRIDGGGERVAEWRDIAARYNESLPTEVNDTLRDELPHLAPAARAEYGRELQRLALTVCWLENDVDHQAVEDLVDFNYGDWEGALTECEFRGALGDMETDWPEVSSRVRADLRWQSQIVWDRALRDNAGAGALDRERSRRTS